MNCAPFRSFAGIKSTEQLTNVRALVQNRFVIVETLSNSKASTSNQLKFPLIWLRDNCQCSECFHASSMSRTIDWTTFDFMRAKPKTVSVSIS